MVCYFLLGVSNLCFGQVKLRGNHLLESGEPGQVALLKQRPVKSV